MIKDLLGRLRQKNGAVESTAPTPPKDELITVYDPYGREMQIQRSEWREKVLAPNLRQNWDRPDELYNLIVSALNDGFFSDVAEATDRLLAIDPIPERSHTIKGIVLMKLGQLDKAEAVLRAGMERAGETGTLLTNLAKVYAERGDHAESETLLWRAIERDPNMENGLLWWAAIHNDREGQAGYGRALKAAAAIPGSWRPQLWIARTHLQAGEVATARALYEGVLTAGLFDSDALMMISGDLGNSGHEKLIPDLIAPIYDPHRHGPNAGLNLLQAYLQLGYRDEGQALLRRLYALNMPPFKQHLDHYADAFDKINPHKPKPIPQPDELKIETVALERPVWAYGLRDPDWLFAAKPKSAGVVTFLSFAKHCSLDAQAEEQQEDAIGRLTRAVPLYLAEAVHFWTSHKARTLIPIVVGGGPVVFGKEPDGAALCQQFAAGSAYLVIGVIEETSAGFRITCSLWETASGTCRGERTVETTPEHFGTAMHELERYLLEGIGETRYEPWDAFYLRPSPDAMEPYLTALAQSLILTLVANERMSKETLWGERNLIEWPLRMALHWPSVETLKLMYFAGLGKAGDYGSEVLPEFQERTLQLLKDAQRDGSQASRLAPLAWSVFGMNEELEKHRQALGDDTRPEYREWLGRLVNRSDEK